MAPADDKKPTREATPESPKAEAAPEVQSEERKDQGPPPPKWEADLDSYPLQEKSADKPWAVRTVWTWMGILTACLIFILTMLVLGALND